MELETKQGIERTEVFRIPEDWRIAILRNEISLISGQHILAKDYNTDGNGLPYLTGPSDFDKGDLIISKWTTKPNKIAYKDDILLTVKGSGAGSVFKLNIYEAAISRQLMAIRPSSIPSSYIFYFFIYEKENYSNLAVGNLIPGLSRQDILDSYIPLPPTLAEQKAIATALSEVDALITSLDQLIQKKEAIKQGAMQELLTGKTRLQGFEGSGRFKQTEVGRIPEEWEVKNLNRILTFGSGQDYKHLSQGDIPVYGTGGLMTFVDNYLYNGDSVGIGRKGTIDKPIFLSGKFWTVDTLFYTNNFVDTTPKFIYYKFLMIPWLEYNEASGVPSLNKNTIGNIKISLPSTLTEQKAIAKVLSNMDAEIEQLQTKKAKYQRIKQGMMQELLTGKTRLI